MDLNNILVIMLCLLFGLNKGLKLSNYKNVSALFREPKPCSKFPFIWRSNIMQMNDKK